MARFHDGLARTCRIDAVKRKTMISGLSVATLLLAAACGADEGNGSDRIALSPVDESASHGHGEHGHDDSHGNDSDDGHGDDNHGDHAMMGDGLASEAGGYRIDDVRLPAASEPGEVSFRILDEDDEPLSDYEITQTKPLHQYVVRTDLAEFHHIHPDLAEGTWSTPLTIERPGDYRVVAEFLPEGADEAVVLAQEVTVPGDWSHEHAPTGEAAATNDDGSVQIALGSLSDGEMTLLVSDLDGNPVELGTYLGSAAHVTGFALESGRFVHAHPEGDPVETDEGTELEFHVAFPETGDFRLFVQVRHGDEVRTVPITVHVH